MSEPPGALRPEDSNLDAFTNLTLLALSEDDDTRLRQLGQVVMAPIFVEKFIDDIRPGNEWNDVLYLAARRLIELTPELRYLMPSLEDKKAHVKKAGKPFRKLVRVERTGGQVSFKPR